VWAELALLDAVLHCTALHCTGSHAGHLRELWLSISSQVLISKAAGYLQ
jgi:hypothetical protein